jgi:hypothetical protein
MIEQSDLEKAKKIIDDKGDSLKRKYLADAVGVGFKIKDGKMTDKIALLFYVRNKKNKKELLQESKDFIPTEIDGVATDVIEVSGGFKPITIDIHLGK